MIDILLVPTLLVIILVMIHAWFGLRVLEKGIIFTDLAIAQFAALGSSISLGYFHSEYFYPLTLSFALLSAFLIALASQRELKLEAFIGLLYVLGASGIMMVLANSSEGMEHFKSLLASDILFTPMDDVIKSTLLYIFIALTIWKVYPRLKRFYKDLMFFSLLALTVSSSVQLAGVLVVFVLLIAPALVATSLSLEKPLRFSFFFGWFFSIAAIIISYQYDLPTGYAIVFLGALLSALIVLFSSKKSITSSY
jgi:zinc/manganese transport system permease protein